MPFYTYKASDSVQSCDHCRDGFEQLQKISDAKLAVCPACGAPISKIITAPAIGRSRTGLDSRAKSAGFHKLKKIGNGEYEKLY